MEGTLVNYRRGRQTMRGNQMIVRVDGYETRAKAAQLIGKRVLWHTPAKKEIAGKVVGVHGNSGAVRARFNRGMPGQAIGTKVTILDKGVVKKAPAARKETPKAKPAAPKAKKKPVPEAKEKAEEKR